MPSGLTPCVFSWLLRPGRSWSTAWWAGGTDSAEKIQQRLRRARDEMALAADYDYFIINDDVERAAAELNDIFRVEHFKPTERMYLVKD